MSGRPFDRGARLELSRRRRSRADSRSHVVAREFAHEYGDTDALSDRPRSQQRIRNVDKARFPAIAHGRTIPTTCRGFGATASLAAENRRTEPTSSGRAILASASWRLTACVRLVGAAWGDETSLPFPPRVLPSLNLDAAWGSEHSLHFFRDPSNQANRRAREVRG